MNNTKYIRIKELRKKEHIKFFTEGKHRNQNYLDDIILKNNSLPEFDFDKIDTESIFLNKRINYPILINAITGGFDEAFQINKDLATIAEKFNIPIAVGSQTISFKNYKYESFKIVREIMKDKVVIANVSANTNYNNAMEAVDMLNADALQLHMNVPQEMCMKEGDRNFKGILNNIEQISKKISVPVIAKEVGFGMSKETARKLFDVGVRYIDIAGKGGTNFIEIEDLRNGDFDFSELYLWGIPTALSLIECSKISEDLNITASGGITKAEDIIKSLCLGAHTVGISGMVLRKLVENGYEECEKYITELLYKFKILLMLSGCKNLEQIKNISYYIKGDLKLALL